MERWKAIKQLYLAVNLVHIVLFFITLLDGKTSLDIYENLVYIHSLDGDYLGLNSWSHLQKKIRLMLDSWVPLLEKYGEFPHKNWKWRELDQRHTIFYTYSSLK